MTWVAWRQMRLQCLITAALLGALAVLLVITGLHLHAVYHSVGGAHCIARYNCARVKDSYRLLAKALGPLLLAIPALLGMFWGAPLVAGELESGTYRLAWTQSVSRRDWLTAKMAVVGVAAMIVAALSDLLIDWWYGPLDAVNLNRLDPSVFTERGIVAIGYTAFAFAIGVGAGALLRRVLPAVAATLLGFAVVRLAYTVWIRPHLLPNSHVVIPVQSPARGRKIPNAWVISDPRSTARPGISTARFHELVVRECRLTALRPCTPINHFHGQVAIRHVTYQAAGHYWPLQEIETIFFLAVAAILIWITIGRMTPASADGPPPERPVVALLPVRTPDSAAAREPAEQPQRTPSMHRRLTGLPRPSS